MSDPIDLAAERESRREGYEGVTCPCGSTWFNARIAIDQAGRAHSYAWPVTCTECGTPIPQGDVR